MHKSNVAYAQHITYTKDMADALGGYIKTLRLRQGLTQAEVQRRLKKQFDISPDRSTLYRAENGKHWPEGDLLTALMDLLGGRLEDLIWLRRNSDASEAEGVDLAEKWLRERGDPTDVSTIMQAKSRADADEIAAELEDLAKKIRAGRE